MFKKLDTFKRLLLASSLVLVCSFSTVAMARADVSKEEVCKGLGFVETSSGDCTTSENGGDRSVEGTIRSVVTILSYLVGAISVIMLIVGGLRYVLSGGDSGNVTSAKNTILYALVGIAVVILAQIIVNFVIKEVTAPPPAATAPAD